MQQIDRPQVLLLGNGLNINFGGTLWKDLMECIWSNPDFSFNPLMKCPMPLQAIIATADAVGPAMKKHAKLFYGSVTDEFQRARLNRLLAMGFDHILTTNYSYELECAALGLERITDYKLKTLLASMLKDKGGRAESKYLLHTCNRVVSGKVTNHIWHIHGEARKPGSMVIGHYYYGMLLNRYISFFEGRSDDYQKHQKKGTNPSVKSWLDAFILGDVYILGFGFDLSEFDLWWLLNRKKRERATVGKVHYYQMMPAGDTAAQQKEKLELLRLMNVEVHSLDLTENDDPEHYKQFYTLAMDDIQHRLKAHR